MADYPGTVIYSQIQKKDPNWKLIEDKITEMGDHINMLIFGEDETFLSATINNACECSANLYKLTELFLKHGYDVKANDGKNGAYCLHRLCMLRDPILLRISELLLDAGADPGIPMEQMNEDFTVLDNIYWCGQNTYNHYDLYDAYYDQIDSYMDGRPYNGIRSFDVCIGGVVRKIEKLTFDRGSIISDIQTNYGFEGALLIWVDDKQLIVSHYTDFIINPNVADEAVNRVDISDQFEGGIIGAKVKRLDFYSRGDSRIVFENPNSYIHFFDMPQDEGWFVRYASGSLDKCGVDLRAGMTVDAVYLNPDEPYTGGICKYFAEKAFLKMGESVIMVKSAYDKAYDPYTGNGHDARNHHVLSVNKFPEDWLLGKVKMIDDGPYYIGAVLRGDNDDIKMIHLVDKKRKNLLISVEGLQYISLVKTSESDNGGTSYEGLQFRDCEISMNWDGLDEGIDLPDDKHDTRPPWNLCAVGNIVKTRTDKDGQIRYGTKELSPGAKVYLKGKLWREIDSSIQVIGFGRNGRYRVADIPIEFIENVRLQTTYKPDVIDLMDHWEYYDQWWHRTGDDKREIKRFIELWNRVKGRKTTPYILPDEPIFKDNGDAPDEDPTRKKSFLNTVADMYKI